MTTRAVAAIGDEYADHAIAFRQIACPGTCFDDFAGCFVPEHHGHGSRAAAINHAQVRMAEAGGTDTDENFARTWRIELALLDG